MIWLAALCLAIWAYLIALHGRFWSAGPVLPAACPVPAPAIAIIVPARNEAPTINAALRSLLTQDYAGPFTVILVNDRSTDATDAIARSIDNPSLTIIDGAPRPPGWSGKLWAVHQGIAAAASFSPSLKGGAGRGVTAPPQPDLLLLTDADIVHAPAHLAALAAKLTTDQLDLVSEMVALNCESLAERALVPAFVFFFQLLYPFARVNDPAYRTAAAAGGTVLIRASALARIGGIGSLRGALIDDVTLATRVKRSGGGIWLGHAALAWSRRPYPGAADIWRMVARTAFVQLRFSWWLLAGCTLGMALVWLAPPALALFGHGAARALGLLAWIAATASYLPTLRRFRLSSAWCLLLPAIAGFYMAATIASGLDHLRGRGVRWKDRAYTDPAAAR